MNAGCFRRAILPALGVVISLAAPLACADSDAVSNPSDPEEAGPSPEAGAGDTGRPLEDAPSPATCSPGGFCPTPLSGAFPLFATSALSASDASDAWAVGQGGIVRWDGSSWTLAHPMTIAPSGAHDGIWTTKADDMWLTTAKKIVRFSKQGSAAPAFREFANELDVAASWMDLQTNVLWEVASESGGPAGVYRFRDDGGSSLVTENLNLQVVTGDGGTYRWRSIWGFGAADVHVGGEMCPQDYCGDGSADLRGAIAHYDGASWSIALLDAKQSVNAMFGTTEPSAPRHLWLSLGPLTLYDTSSTSIRLVPVDSSGHIGTPIVSKDLPMPAIAPSMNESCTHIVGSAYSPNDGWISNGCLVYRWDGAKLDLASTAVNGLPLGRVNALWAGAAGRAWIVGETTESGFGFASQRKGGDL